ncbi:TPA: glycosyltransferase [Citrobacter freundii]|nr:glycosyltransferase [Citrobacter freundii]
MPTPLVSIIVTSYNHDAFLAEALESVFSQGRCE